MVLLMFVVAVVTGNSLKLSNDISLNNVLAVELSLFIRNDKL